LFEVCFLGLLVLGALAGADKLTGNVLHFLFLAFLVLLEKGFDVPENPIAIPTLRAFTVNLLPEFLASTAVQDASLGLEICSLFAGSGRLPRPGDRHP